MKEKIKELADSVGAVYPVLFMGRHDGVLFTETELETFVELVAAHAMAQPCCGNFATCQQACMPKGAAVEREACAKVCDDWPNGRDDVYSIGVAIRARGTK